MIEKLLPADVVAVEAFGDLAEIYDFAEEKQLVAGAVGKRRREFITARRCAHMALQRMGIDPVPICSGADRAPIWPRGIVGSITHCAGYRAAALARCAVTASVGIDAEPNQPLAIGVGDLVLRPAERAQLRSLPLSAAQPHWDRLLFSSKEAVYKAWYPLTGRWLEHQDVDVVIDPVNQEFQARLLVDGRRRDGAAPLRSFRGRYLAHSHLIITAVTVATAPR